MAKQKQNQKTILDREHWITHTHNRQEVKQFGYLTLIFQFQN